MGELEDKLKGKANQIKGTLTGSDADRAKGFAQEKKGELKEGFENLKKEFRDATRDVPESHEEPSP